VGKKPMHNGIMMALECFAQRKIQEKIKYKK
jgi:hypothetical protein